MESAKIAKIRATITSIERSPSGMVCFVRCKPDDSFVFQEGQFVMISAENILDETNGKKIKKAYSIATTQSELDRKGTIGFIIKQTHSGGVSEYLTQKIKIGDAITIEGPYGQMLNPRLHKKYLLIATGSGLAPILSLYEAIIAKQGNTKVAMLYGERYLNMLLPSVAEIFSKNHLIDEDGERKIMRSLYLSKEESDQIPDSFWKIGHVQDGVDASLDFLKDELGGIADIQVFICGMPAMVDEIKETLLSKGFSKEQIALEKY